MNFNITNKADSKTTTIDILGDIGDTWWYGDEATSKTIINDQLKAIDAENIIVNISSLGGDVDHALSIHDLLKMHKAHITTRMIGATASSGTIIAMAGDEITMSENALFLVHHPSTGVWGQEADVENALTNLKAWGARIVDLYKGQTGKRKSQISSLMSEERWIEAKEAKDFGFVDTVFTPAPVAANAALTDEQKTKLLNDLKNQYENKIKPKIKKMNDTFKNLNTLLDIDGLEVDDDKGTYLNAEQLTAIDAGLTEPQDNAHDVAAAVEANRVEMQGTIDGHLATIATNTTDITTHAATVDGFNTTIAGLTAEVTNFKAMIDKAGAKGLTFTDAGEPTLAAVEQPTERDKKMADNAAKVADYVGKHTSAPIKKQ